jgi:allantoin racemase
MAMRIWHQSTTVLKDVPHYIAELRKRVAQVARPDTEVVLHGFLPETFPADYPAADKSLSYLAWLHSNQWVAAAIEAERQGYDAVMFANLSCPTIEEARTLVDIPVIGQGETVYRTAGFYGRKFGNLGFVAGRFENVPLRIAEWGLASSFVGVRGIGVPFTQVMKALAGERNDVVERVVQTGERLVKEDGADVIIPGEIPLSLLLAREGITRIADAPIMDGLACVLKMTETAVDLKRLAGMSQSRRGLFHAAPARARVEGAMEFYGLDRLQQRFSAFQAAQ